MGYNTIFKGELKFTHDPSAKELAHLKKMLGEDFRDHPEWGRYPDLSYIDLVLTEDFSGLRWNDETEKTYHLEKIVNALTAIMRKTYPEFGLDGFLQAQGEEAEDRWDLVMIDGVARKCPVPIPGTKVECPECGHKFRVALPSDSTGGQK